MRGAPRAAGVVAATQGVVRQMALSAACEPGAPVPRHRAARVPRDGACLVQHWLSRATVDGVRRGGEAVLRPGHNHQEPHLRGAVSALVRAGRLWPPPADARPLGVPLHEGMEGVWGVGGAASSSRTAHLEEQEWYARAGGRAGEHEQLPEAARQYRPREVLPADYRAPYQAARGVPHPGDAQRPLPGGGHALSVSCRWGVRLQTRSHPRACDSRWRNGLSRNRQRRSMFEKLMDGFWWC